MTESKAIEAVDIGKIWTDSKQLKTIREMYCPSLNDEEFRVFATLGKMTGLNPAMREIWAVKYGNKAASIFVGRDGYRKSSQAHKAYGSHSVDAVYSNDSLETNSLTGEVKHSRNLTDRGALVGAYCIVHRKTSNIPMFNYVELKEYAQPHGVWKEKPATMIKKVAEAQGLRGAFQELFSGTYGEAEQWDARQVEASPAGSESAGSDKYAEVETIINDAKDLKELEAARDFIVEYGNTGDLPAPQVKELTDKLVEKYEKFKAEDKVIDAEVVAPEEEVDMAAAADEVFGEEKPERFASEIATDRESEEKAGVGFGQAKEDGNMDAAIEKQRMRSSLEKKKSVELRDYINGKGWDCPGSKMERVDVIMAHEFKEPKAANPTAEVEQTAGGNTGGEVLQELFAAA